MANNNQTSRGSVYYNKSRKNFVAEYYINDPLTGEKKRCKKSFKTSEEANQFLNELQYKKGNELFMKYNGIPANELMRYLIQRKIKTNTMSSIGYLRAN